MARLDFLLWAMALLMASSTHIKAAIIDSDTTITAANSFPDENVVIVDGANPPTIVDILPDAIVGSIESMNTALRVTDTSIVTVFGGTINGRIGVQVDATVNLVNLDPGTHVEDVSVDHNATFNMSGGQVGTPFGGGEIRVSEGSPTLNISGGVIKHFLTTQWGGATINVTGGEINGFLRIHGNTTAHWWGGNIGGTTVWDDAQLHVYGFDLAFDDECGCRLLGRLADGTPVDFQPILRGNGTIILHEATDTPGDSFPLDSAVDIDDLNRVRNHFSQGQMGGDPVPGDTFPFDGIVDVNDLNRIRNHFGRTQPPVPVPEPATGAVLLLGIATLFAASCLRRANG